MDLRSIACVVGVALFMSVPQAFAAEWRITRASGDVRVHNLENMWVKAERLQVLKPGESVWTGRRSRAQIETEDGAVILHSGSLVKVPARKLPEGTTVLLQRQGNLKAKVEKRDKRHFSIQTPYLAAVVKGTEFTIDMKSQTTSLSVSRGAVGAIGVGTRQEVSVDAGQSISMSNKADASPGGAESGSGGSDTDSNGSDGDRAGRDGGGSLFAARSAGGGGGGSGGGSGGGHGCRRCGGWGHGWGHGRGSGWRP